jgi:hypothetical protein
MILDLVSVAVALVFVNVKLKQQIEKLNMCKIDCNLQMWSLETVDTMETDKCLWNQND